ncbi:hypothetical protein [Paenibacillus macerans]|uniref:hypothetical protein n=1 Tax=Paenibacillus macerans TaxID=44252 RepID=UPI003D31E8D3
MERLPELRLTDLLPDKPLRAAEPRLYDSLVHELARLGLHPYDVKAGGQANDQGVSVRLRYGERFDRLESRFFPWDSIERNDERISAFMRDAAVQVKKVLISEYYKRG